jgi:hypothetical protein
MGRAAFGPCGSIPHIPTASHDRDVGLAAGRNGSGYRSRVRIPSGALRAPVAQWVERPVRAVSMTAATSSEMSDRGPERIGYLSPWEHGRPRTSARRRRVSTRSSPHDRVSALGLRAGVGAVISQSARALSGRSRARHSPAPGKPGRGSSVPRPATTRPQPCSFRGPE